MARRMKKNRPYIERSAIYGLAPTLDVAFRVILRASGRDDMRTFPDADSALTWLQTGRS